MRTLAALLGLAFIPSSICAQVARIALRPADAAHPEEFTVIGSVRELSDGRLLVGDGRERRIVALDFASEAVKPVGRSGSGPGEYRFVTALRPLGGDTTLMTDAGARRILIFHRDSAVATLPADHPAVAATDGGLIFGADRMGRVLTRRQAERRDGETITGREDSTSHVLIPLRGGRQDTVVRTLNMPRVNRISRGPDGRITSSATFPRTLLPAEEQAILFPDGWLAVARIDPFRVEWRTPDGRWVRGRPIPVPLIKLDAREREAHRARYGAPAPPTPATPPPPLPLGARPPEEYPEHLPPFASGSALQVGPADLLLIRRPRSADETGTNYFVVDRTGRLVGEIVLRQNETIVGAGPRHLYVSERDEDDILRIRRHPWPTTR